MVDTSNIPDHCDVFIGGLTQIIPCPIKRSDSISYSIITVFKSEVVDAVPL